MYPANCSPVLVNISGLDGGPADGELRWASLLILLVIIPTVGGNILVILAVFFERKLQNVTNYFLTSLAVADLLVGLLVMPVAMVTVLYNSSWPMPEFLCPIWIFLDVLFSTASIMHLCAISLDRYVAIKRPIQHSQSKSPARAKGKIAAVWLISIGIAISIPIEGLRNAGVSIPQHKTCLLNPSCVRWFMLVGSFAAFFLPLVIMMVIYMLTIQELKKKVYLLKFRNSHDVCRSSVSTVSQKELGKVPARGPSRARQPRARLGTGRDVPCRRRSSVGLKSLQNLSNEQRASKVLGIVFLLFVVMWCPFFITNVIFALLQTETISRLMEVFVWVGYVSSGINPLVYTLFNKIFRQAFARYITCNYRGGNGRRLSTFSFRSSAVEEAPRVFMRNGKSPAGGYQSALCLRTPVMPCSTTTLLDTLFLTDNEDCRDGPVDSFV